MFSFNEKQFDDEGNEFLPGIHLATCKSVFYEKSTGDYAGEHFSAVFSNENVKDEDEPTCTYKFRARLDDKMHDEAAQQRAAATINHVMKHIVKVNEAEVHRIMKTAQSIEELCTSLGKVVDPNKKVNIKISQMVNKNNNSIRYGFNMFNRPYIAPADSNDLIWNEKNDMQMPKEKTGGSGPAGINSFIPPSTGGFVPPSTGGIPS